MAGRLSAFFGAQDMTQGSPMGNLVKFSVPLLIGNMAQQLYSTVDSIVVGNYVGDGALAAVGASNPILNLLLVLFMGISMGATVMVSQYYGAKDREKLTATVGTTITATFLASVFIMIVGPLVSRPIMTALGTPADILEDACAYLIIIFLGIIGSGYYNIISGILRGLGDSIMPLIFLLVACGLNTALDVWFVAGLHWGVAGAAIATIIGQFLACALSFWFFWRVKDGVRFLVSPASNEVYLQALEEGIIETLLEAGAMVMNSNCSVCWGSCQGVIGENEVLVSTGTRNFKGRAGHKTSKVYLASAAVVTASAVAGYITGPESL